MPVPDTPHIDPSGRQAEATDFQDLYRSGLAAIQDLAGMRWTDYNAHDPGVTLLEQLCYALTECGYKSEFPVPDYLAGPDGTIDADKQAIYGPEQILPCRPVTPGDFRAAILDAVPEIEDLHLEKANSHAPGGLYTLHLRLSDVFGESSRGGSSGHDPEDIIERAAAVYCRHRNLCEDIADVRIISPARYFLRGRIETDGRHDGAELMARIYFCCARLISSGVTVTSYAAAIRQGRSLEQILDGPLLERGLVDYGADGAGRRPMTLGEIFSAVRDIPGVVGIHELALVDADENPITVLPAPGADAAAALEIPDRSGKIGVRLVKKTKAYPVAATAFRTAFDRMEDRFRTRRDGRADLADLFAMPKGEPRPLATYASVQNHFPRVYGIGQDGVPSSAGPRRMAQARQLKAYLLFFDQFMADFNAQISRMGRLFSAEPYTRSSYYFQRLDEGDAAGAADLFSDTGGALDARLSAIMARYDDYNERCSRMLDYLLATYGESFNQTYLRQFHHYISPTRIAATVNENKARLLKHLPAIGRDRGAAPDYRRPEWNDGSLTGFERKARILLGLGSLENRPLAEAVAGYGLRLVADDRLAEQVGGELPPVDVERDAGGTRPIYREIPPEPVRSPVTKEAVEALKQSIPLLKYNLVNETFFRQGMDIHNYLMGPPTPQGAYPVVFKPFDRERWFALAQFDDGETAVRTVNALCRFFVEVNQASEGLHLLEHILLRPLAGERHEGVVVPDGFYAFRMTVVLPSWTVRFHDKAFKRHAEDTLRLNCPAHIAVDLRWLDHKQMLAFEKTYGQWRTLKSEYPGGSPDLDAHSAELIRLVLGYGRGPDDVAAEGEVSR